MKIRIGNKTFDVREITQLYPAALVKTGYREETTQVSLEWLDTEAQGKVEVAGYGIFVHTSEEEKHAFVFETRAQMDALAADIAAQLKGEKR
jgi:uncharacterized lipoprotein YmbA